MKVLLIEDEQKTAASIKSWLEEARFAVDCAFDSFTGRRLAEQSEYDIILSDVIMPGINGIELCRNLREKGVKAPILLLSALSRPEDKVAGLNAGADDYLAKPFDFQELLARIHALIRRSGGPADYPVKLSFADLELNLHSLEVWRAGVKVTLTPREFALLEYLVRNQGRVVPKAEISEKVWNLDAEINTNVIGVYVGYLRNKIDKGFDKRLIHTHFGVGYVLKAE
ncbi:MAG: response regulator transcription factor [Saprospiraceae bacterium]|nr:response regulator transcription factor [Saprospiraceae bacterium]